MTIFTSGRICLLKRKYQTINLYNITTHFFKLYPKPFHQIQASKRATYYKSDGTQQISFQTQTFKKIFTYTQPHIDHQTIIKIHLYFNIHNPITISISYLNQLS